MQVGLQLKDQNAAKEKLLCEALSRVKVAKFFFVWPVPNAKLFLAAEDVAVYR